MAGRLTLTALALVLSCVLQPSFAQGTYREALSPEGWAVLTHEVRTVPLSDEDWGEVDTVSAIAWPDPEGRRWELRWLNPDVFRPDYPPTTPHEISVLRGPAGSEKTLVASRFGGWSDSGTPIRGGPVLALRRDPWRVTRIAYRGIVGSTDPDGLVILVEHVPSGAWWAREFSGEVLLSVDVDGEGRLVLVSSVYGVSGPPLSTFEERAWRLEIHDGKIVVAVLPPRYRWGNFCGTPSSTGATEREGRHLGQQEAGWHLDRVDDRGGLAIAFGDSPRIALASQFWCPLLPARGARQVFEWPAEVYSIAYEGPGRWIPREEAVQLARRGGWDVVLFRHRRGVSAERLIEHRFDLPHSTPH